MMNQIYVIDHSFDTSLHFYSSSQLNLQSNMSTRENESTSFDTFSVKSNESYSTAPTSLVETIQPTIPTPTRRRSTLPVDHNSLENTLASITFEFDSLANLPNVPAYIPPPRQMVFALYRMTDVLQSDSTPTMESFVKTRPNLPLAKTNTNMCNYAHRLHLYRLYLERQLAIQQLQRQLQGNARVVLRHHYNQSLSRALSSRVSSHTSLSRATI